jgi:hypothetical protein
MAFIVKKNPQQKLHQELGHHALSGEQFFFRKEMPKSMYINVAMQMMPPSKTSNTASSTKA